MPTSLCQEGEREKGAVRDGHGSFFSFFHVFHFSCLLCSFFVAPLFVGRKRRGLCRKSTCLPPLRAPKIEFPHHKKKPNRKFSVFQFSCVLMCFLFSVHFSHFHFSFLFLFLMCVTLMFFLCVLAVLLFISPGRFFIFHLPCCCAYRTSSGNLYCNSFASKNKKKRK